MLCRKVVQLGLLSASLVVALPTDGYACSNGIWCRVEPVKANGLVRLQWNCEGSACSELTVPDSIRIRDQETKKEIPGEVVWSHGIGTHVATAFWRPSEPLTAGRSYRVLDVAADSAKTPLDFTVMPEVTWAATSELEAHGILETNMTIAPGETSCPSRYDRIRCSPDDPPSPEEVTLNTLMRTVMWMHASVTHKTAVPPLKWRAAYWRDGDARPDLAEEWSTSASTQRFDEGAERYCYHLAVQNLLDGSEREWEDCVEHGDNLAVEAHARDAEEIARETERCSQPPEGLEKEWCEQSTMMCERISEQGPVSDKLRADCENVAKRCASQQDAGAEPAERDSGCSVMQPRAAGPARIWLLALALPLLLRRKRKLLK